jgi:hypothetical protein
MLDSTEVTEVTVTTDDKKKKVMCACDNNSRDLIIWFTIMVKTLTIMLPVSNMFTTIV